MLRALVASGDATMVDHLTSKVANYMAGITDDGWAVNSMQFLDYLSSQSAYMLTASLLEYDSFKGSTDPHASLAVIGNGKALVSTAVNSEHRTASALLPWSEATTSADRPVSTLHFVARGRGELSVVFGLQFTPLRLPTRNAYRGIGIERFIVPCNSTRKRPLDAARMTIGGQATTVAGSFWLGERVCVSLQVTSADDLGAVLITDNLAGGLEAQHEGQDLSELWHGSGWWFMPRFYRKVYTDRVDFLVSALRAGTHVFQYEAIAATTGQFTLPPAEAFAVAHKELSGRTFGGAVVIAKINHEMLARS